MYYLLLAGTLNDQINNHPATPYFFYAVLIVLGFVAIYRGKNAIRTKRFRGKYGRVTTGEGAVITGKFFVGLGGVMIAIGSLMLLFKGGALLMPDPKPADNGNIAWNRLNAGVRGNGTTPSTPSPPANSNPAGNGNRSVAPPKFVQQPVPAPAPQTKVLTPAAPPKTSTLATSADDSLPAIQSMSQEKNVASLAFSPDGKLLLSADARRFSRRDDEPWHVYIWDVETGQMRQKMALQNAADRVRFGPKGNMVAVSDLEGLLTLWELPSGNPIKTIDTLKLTGGRFGYRYDFDFAGSPKTLVIAGNDGIAVVDVETGDVKKNWKNHTPITFAVAASADGSRAITGGSGDEFLVVSLPSGGIIDRYRTASKQVESLAISRDGRRAIVRSHYTNLSIWDFEARKNLFAIPGVATMGLAVEISPDGSRVASVMTSPPAVHIWDADTGEVVGQFNRHSKGVGAVAISPDGRLCASGDYNGQIQLWEMPTK